MFTYDSIGTMDDFTMMRPVFNSALIIMTLVFITIVIPKLRDMYNHVLPILLISVMGAIVSAQVLFYEGVFVDELGLSGDPVTFFLCLIIGGLALVNPCLYLWNKQPKASRKGTWFWGDTGRN